MVDVKVRGRTHGIFPGVRGGGPGIRPRRADDRDGGAVSDGGAD